MRDILAFLPKEKKIINSVIPKLLLTFQNEDLQANVTLLKKKENKKRKRRI